jgi:hypothetical protein
MPASPGGGGRDKRRYADAFVSREPGSGSRALEPLAPRLDAWLDGEALWLEPVGDTAVIDAPASHLRKEPCFDQPSSSPTGAIAGSPNNAEQ